MRAIEPVTPPVPVRPRPSRSTLSGTIRRRFGHRRVGRRVAVLALAGSAALAAGRLGVADSRGTGTGLVGTGRVLVPVAGRDLAPGDVLGPDDLEWAAVEPRIAHVAGEPAGEVVHSPIHAGEIIHPDRLGPGRTGLGPGERAVALVPPSAPLSLATGDVVELVAISTDSVGGLTVEPLRTPARVLAVADESVTVAVPTDVAADVVGHQATGAVEMLLTPWQP